MDLAHSQRLRLSEKLVIITPYVCGFASSDRVHGCMVYTELAPRRQQFHVAPAMPVQYTTSVDIQNRAIESYD